MSDDGHKGSVVVGRIDSISRDGDQILGDGVFLSDNEDSDAVVGMMAEGALRGISVDVDSAEMSVEDFESGKTTFSKGRISGATIVSIPAFAEAVIEMGGAAPEEEFVGDDIEEFKDYDTATRKKMAKSGTALPDGSFPIANCDDLMNARNALGRASDPDKAKAHIRKRASALGCELPEGYAAELETFAPNGPGDKRGPGWVTAPKATRTIHAYWTKGKGAAKIGWGTPGDFNRCKRQLSKYVGPQYLNRTCAEWHFDALGYWPATHAARDKGKHALDEAPCCSLTASISDILPAAMFANPELKKPTPITIDGDHVYGHIAQWGVCHTSVQGTCTVAPRGTDYRYYRTGAVETDEGLIPVGQLTMTTGHPELSVAPMAAKGHYDNTGTVVADVVCGEDEHGIWFSGALRPNLTADQRREFLGGAISGDWREIAGNLEMVAALVVNIPGFPIPRIGLAASGGRQVSLVAAGIVMPQETVTIGDIAVAVMNALDERDRRRERVRRLTMMSRKERLAAITASVMEEE